MSSNTLPIPGMVRLIGRKNPLYRPSPSKLTLQDTDATESSIFILSPTPSSDPNDPLVSAPTIYICIYINQLTPVELEPLA